VADGLERPDRQVLLRKSPFAGPDPAELFQKAPVRPSLAQWRPKDDTGGVLDRWTSRANFSRFA
jgi:hypothetical protein